RGGGGSLSGGCAATGDESRPSGPDRGGLHPVGGGAARISGRALAPAEAARSPAAGGQHGGAGHRRARRALANVTNPFRGAQAAVTTGGRRSIVIDRWHLTGLISVIAGLQRCHGWRGRPAYPPRHRNPRRSFPGALAGTRRAASADSSPCRPTRQ